MNLVERFFADLTGDVVREGSFTSVAELTRSIEVYLVQCNLTPQADYRWKAKGQETLEKIHRARQALNAAGLITTYFNDMTLLTVRSPKFTLLALRPQQQCTLT